MQFQEYNLQSCKKISHASKVFQLKTKLKNSRTHNLKIEESEEKAPESYTLLNTMQMGQGLLTVKIKSKFKVNHINSSTPFFLMPIKSV